MEFPGMAIDVLVKRNRDPIEALSAAVGGANVLPYINQSPVLYMPGRANYTEVVQAILFKLDYGVDEEGLAEELKLRGLASVDPYVLSALNEVDPLFSATFPNGTHWRDNSGKWCICKFSQRNGVREVSAGYRFRFARWSNVWWFAGILVR